MKASIYLIKVEYEDPKGITHFKEHNEAIRRFRLDKRMALAYLMVLMEIKQLINLYKYAH